MSPDPTNPGNRRDPRRRSSQRRFGAWHRGLRLSGYGLAGLIVVAALAVSLLRLLIPMVPDYRLEVEETISELLDTRMRVERIDAQWRGLRPDLVLEGVTLIDPRTNLPFLRFSRIDVSLDPVGSLLAGTLQTGHLRLTGGRLNVVRSRDGRLRIGGVSTPRSGAPGGDSELALRWLLNNASLALEGTHIHFEDHAREESIRYDFTDVTLLLVNSGDRHRLAARVDLPDHLGQRLNLQADFTGPAQQPADWEGDLYLQAEEIDVGELARLVTNPWLRIDSGRASAEAWGSWRGRVVDDLRLDFQGRGLSLQRKLGDRAAPWAQIDRAEGTLDVRRRKDGGWRVDLRGLETAWTQGTTAPVDGTLHVANGEEGALSITEGVLDRLRLEEWMPYLGLLALPEERAGEWLRRLAPRGELRGLRFRSTGPRTLSLSGDFEDFGLSGGFDGIPSLEGLDGHFQMVGREAVVALRTEEASVDFHGYFRRPMIADTLSGELRVRAGEGAISLASGDILISNEDIGGRIRVAMDIDPDADTFLDLRAHVYRARGASTYRYLPVGILDDPVVAWLDRAITNGRGHDVDLLYHGRLRDFLEYGERGNGRFEVRFTVDDATLDYFEGWPPVRADRARIAFVNSSMSARVLKGEALGVPILQGSVRIPELGEAVVEIDARARGDAGRMLEFLRRSPLRGPLEGVIADADAGGQGELGLKIVIPVSSSVDTELTVDADLTVEQARLRYPGRGIDLEGIAGRFAFTESGVSAEGVRARLSGSDVLVDIATATEDARRWTTVSMQGRMPTGLISSRARSPLLERISGTAPWDVSLQIAHDGAGDQPHLRIRAASSLVGVSLDLPAPVGKRPEERRAIEIRSTFAEAGPGPVELRLGDDLRGVFDLQQSIAGDWSVRRAALRFGDGEPSLPEDEAWDLRGRVERLSLSDWVAALADLGDAAATPAVDRLGALNLTVGSFEALGYELGPAHIASRETGAEVTVRLGSPIASGVITVPASDQPGRPITARLEHLRLQPAEARRREGLSDPRQWPPVRATVGRLETAEHTVDDLRLELTPERNGVRLHLLSLRTAGLELRVEGDWTVSVGGRHRSDFRFEARSEDIGAALSQLDISAAVVGGSGEASAQLRWPDAPLDFVWAGARGEAKVRIDKGSLRDIDPKAGRLIGLFSIEALPRRLALDFDDMTGEGFTFDAIDGSFNITGSEIRTQDLSIRGRSARIDLRGTVDMEDKDYDQVVTVTPKLDATLPVAGALAGGTGVGAAVLVLQQIFKRPIQRSMQFQYTVTGPWSDPRIERIGAPEGLEDDEAGSILDYE